MTFLSQHLLTVLVFLPVAGAAAIALTRREAETTQRLLGLGVSTAVFLLSLLLVRGFEAVPAMQFVEQRSWLPAYGISYHLGVDGLSLWLVILTTLLTPLCLLGSWSSIDQRVREFGVFMLLLEAGMIGVFVSLDLFLFYVFWEAMLIPAYFLPRTPAKCLWYDVAGPGHSDTTLFLATADVSTVAAFRSKRRLRVTLGRM